MTTNMAASDLNSLGASPNFQGFYIAGSTEAIMLGSTHTFTVTSITQTAWGSTYLQRLGGEYTSGGTLTFYTNGTGPFLTDIYDQTTSYGSDLSAVSMQIISISPHVTPIWTVFQCGRNWKANTVYRRVAVGSPTTSTGRTSTATTPGTTATTPATPPSGTAIPLPTNTETMSSEVPAPASASSQAWIAGAVIGPVVGCALVGLLVWWITRYRMKKSAAATGAGSAGWTGAPYHHNQPLAPWPTASPSPSHGKNAQYQGWEAQNKTNSMASGGTVGYPQELSSNQGSNIGHHGEVYEMHQTR